MGIEINKTVWQCMLTQNVDQALIHLLHLISATPTGPERDKLTEVNIHLMVAQTILKRGDK